MAICTSSARTQNVQNFEGCAALAPFPPSTTWRATEDAVMTLSGLLSRQGRCLLQLGVALFLFTSFEGFVVPALAAPHLGRSVHTLSGFTGVLFIAVGLMWPMLKLEAAAARV